ncbi:MAG: hypothetical protein ACM30I_05455 [Gemmatimonas sp.]
MSTPRSSAWFALAGTAPAERANKPARGSDFLRFVAVATVAAVVSWVFRLG